MGKVIVILIVALVLEAIGVVCLSAGLKEIGGMKDVTTSEISRVIRRGATHPKLLLGVLLETLFFLCLLFLLQRHDVSLIWPLTSLGFVLTAFSAHFILGEQVSATRWAGVILIVVGAVLVSWSEKAKSPSDSRTKPAASVPQAGTK